jgi:hypothetical protein
VTVCRDCGRTGEFDGEGFCINDCVRPHVHIPDCAGCGAAPWDCRCDRGFSYRGASGLVVFEPREP